jgi:N6-adenosine-specific RNA methylase IME4
MFWPFSGCPMFFYDLIMADPPWSFATYSDKGHGKSAQRHYSCMSLDDIKALPVDQLAKPDCMLLLWATAPMLPQALETMHAWNFKYVTNAVWHKRTARGKTAFGTGYRLRNAHEHILLGTIGNPQNTRGVRSIIEGKVREHSRKPDEAFEAAVKLMPEARRIELFSREERPGFECWGNQAGLFNQ